MNENNYCVYMHTTPNGKRYVGITSQRPTRRWDKGRAYFHGNNNQHFQRAITKYGWENISHDVLYRGLTQDEASRIERELIKKYDLTNPDNGYNLDLGGIKAGKHSAETRRKISEARKKVKLSESHRLALLRCHKGVPMSEDQKKKISEANKSRVWDRCGKKNPFYGKKHTLEVRQRISKMRPKRKVMCIETGEIFPSITEAEEKYKIGHVTDACKGRVKTSGGYHWQYCN